MCKEIFPEYADIFLWNSDRTVSGLPSPEEVKQRWLNIVVGAGSINLLISQGWYQTKNLLALTGNPQIIYERGDRQKHHPEIQGSINTEYNEARRNPYENASSVIDVTDKSPEKVADEITRIIKAYR
ncbi:nucleoside/nucleotide kinase family protein [Chitinophaga rupis]|uniref:hypothetical protein n=1 Tax=Chitinophaga rupis TaxID=573321 RepID=UPI0011602565|nr:hypothetical protein [Chitinophaga rupis]